MLTPLVLIDATDFKIAKPGFNVFTADDKDLILHAGARNAQIVQKGFTLLEGASVGPGGTFAWYGTLAIDYPDLGGVPLFILQPVIYIDDYGAGGVVSSREVLYYNSWGTQNHGTFGPPNPTAIYPTTMDVNVLTNTQVRIGCSGALAGQKDTNGNWIYAGYVSGFIYMVLRQEIA